MAGRGLPDWGVARSVLDGGGEDERKRQRGAMRRGRRDSETSWKEAEVPQGGEVSPHRPIEPCYIPALQKQRVRLCNSFQKSLLAFNVGEGFSSRAEVERIIAAMPKDLRDFTQWGFLTG